MHGFLNVLGAGVLSAEHHWDEAQTIEMLDDQRPNSFEFHDTVFAWRDWEVTINRIKARRKFVTSFGSCSFNEPREDLQALNFLFWWRSNLSSMSRACRIFHWRIVRSAFSSHVPARPELVSRLAITLSIFLRWNALGFSKICRRRRRQLQLVIH